MCLHFTNNLTITEVFFFREGGVWGELVVEMYSLHFLLGYKKTKNAKIRKQ